MQCLSLSFIDSQSSVAEKYKSALVISGLVTFIAGYHYIRIFNSWIEAYEWQKDGTLKATGVPFNDAYRYMDWCVHSRLVSQVTTTF